MNRTELVAAAHASIARGSKSFNLASKLFDRTTRERAWLLYSWCRRCDDIADGQDHGGERKVVVDAQARLGTIRFLTDSALNGVATGDPAFDAIGVVMRECPIPRAFIDDHIAGFALDSENWYPRSEDDLLRYCYHVAGVVGCMMAVVMGIDPADDDTLDRACDLGLAFQLSNIARDIAEDDAVGRCYLPLDWLTAANMGRIDAMLPKHRQSLADMARRLAMMVGRYEQSARGGAPALPFRSRWAILSATNIYGAIAREVDRLENAAWDHRVVVSKSAKAGFVLTAMGQAFRPAPKSDRVGLWTRPRLS